MARFKATEWMMCRNGNGRLKPTVTLKMLTDLIREHHKVFLVNKTGGWKRTDIEYFLELNNWLYPAYVQEFHIRTCYSILKELNNVDVE